MGVAIRLTPPFFMRFNYLTSWFKKLFRVNPLTFECCLALVAFDLVLLASRLAALGYYSQLDANALALPAKLLGLIAALALGRFLTRHARNQKRKHESELWGEIETTYPGASVLRTIQRGYLALVAALIVCVCSFAVLTLDQCPSSAGSDQSAGPIARSIRGSHPWRIYNTKEIFDKNLSIVDENKMIETVASTYGELSIPYSDLCMALAIKHLKASALEQDHRSVRFQTELNRGWEVIGKTGSITHNFKAEEYGIFLLGYQSALKTAGGQDLAGKEGLAKCLAELNKNKDNPALSEEALEEIYWIASVAAEARGEHQLAGQLENEWRQRYPAPAVATVEPSVVPQSTAGSQSPLDIDLGLALALAALWPFLSPLFLLRCKIRWTRELEQAADREERLDFLGKLTTLALYDNRLHEANKLSKAMLAEVDYSEFDYALESSVIELNKQQQQNDRHTLYQSAQKKALFTKVIAYRNN
jgi:hypothetical protein